MTAMRVAYVLGTTTGGTGRHVAMLASGCLREGLGVAVFGPGETRQLFLPGLAASSPDGAPGPEPGGSRPAPEPGGARIGFEPLEIAERPRPARDAAAVLRLRRLLAQAEPDVVHAHGLRAGAVAALALALPAARPTSLAGASSRPQASPGGGSLARRRAPALVVTVHNAPPAAALARAVYGMLERLVARRAAAVLCVSRDLADRMSRLGARDTALAVVPAPAAAAPSAGAIGRAQDDIGAGAGEGAGGRPVVLAVGRLTDQKGFGTLLDAAARWQHRVPLPLLAIAGEGPLAGELAGTADAAGLAVRFLGQRDDVPALLAAADVCAVPSQWEGQPLIVQEALQAGRPIVASQVGGIPDMTGPAALLVPPGEPARLAAAVLRVLDDQALAGRLSAAALARAAALPSVDEAVQAVLAVYGRLTPAAPASG
jgi:glycosyltransferase involved in cell wall biosynthesis